MSLGIVQSNTAKDHFGELVITPSSGNGIDLKFYRTTPADTEDQLDNLLPKTHPLEKLSLGAEGVNNFWVISDALKVRVFE